MLSAHDGGMPIYDFTALSCAQISEAAVEGRASSKVGCPRPCSSHILVAPRSSAHLSARTPALTHAVQSEQWQDDIVPIARNPEGDLLVVHAAGMYACVYVFGLHPSSLSFMCPARGTGSSGGGSAHATGALCSSSVGYTYSYLYGWGGRRVDVVE
jgi:hypothetical protein